MRVEIDESQRRDKAKHWCEMGDGHKGGVCFLMASAKRFLVSGGMDSRIVVWGGIEEQKSNNLAPEEEERMRELFKKYDKNGDNTMDVSELGAFIRDDLEFELSEEELEKVLVALDKDGSGALSFDEVSAWWAETMSG